MQNNYTKLNFKELGSDEMKSVNVSYFDASSVTTEDEPSDSFKEIPDLESNIEDKEVDNTEDAVIENADQLSDLDKARINITRHKIIEAIKDSAYHLSWIDPDYHYYFSSVSINGVTDRFYFTKDQMKEISKALVNIYDIHYSHYLSDDGVHLFDALKSRMFRDSITKINKTDNWDNKSVQARILAFNTILAIFDIPFFISEYRGANAEYPSFEIIEVPNDDSPETAMAYTGLLKSIESFLKYDSITDEELDIFKEILRYIAKIKNIDYSSNLIIKDYHTRIDVAINKNDIPLPGFNAVTSNAINDAMVILGIPFMITRKSRYNESLSMYYNPKITSMSYVANKAIDALKDIKNNKSDKLLATDSLYMILYNMWRILDFNPYELYNNNDAFEKIEFYEINEIKTPIRNIYNCINERLGMLKYFGYDLGRIKITPNPFMVNDSMEMVAYKIDVEGDILNE